jgi:hypothetical protein
MNAHTVEKPDKPIIPHWIAIDTDISAEDALEYLQWRKHPEGQPKNINLATTIELWITDNLTRYIERFISITPINLEMKKLESQGRLNPLDTRDIIQSHLYDLPRYQSTEELTASIKEEYLACLDADEKSPIPTPTHPLPWGLDIKLNISAPEGAHLFDYNLE